MQPSRLTLEKLKRISEHTLRQSERSIDTVPLSRKFEYCVDGELLFRDCRCRNMRGHDVCWELSQAIIPTSYASSFDDFIYWKIPLPAHVSNGNFLCSDDCRVNCSCGDFLSTSCWTAEKIGEFQFFGQRSIIKLGRQFSFLISQN